MLLFLTAMGLYLYAKTDQAHKRLVFNEVIIQRGIEYFETKNGHQAAKIIAQEHTIAELRAGVDIKLLREIKNINIKIKNLQAYSQTVITNEKHITTIVRDSVINDTTKAEYFCYDDDFYSIHGLKIGDKQHVSISHFDSIFQFVYKGDRITKKGKKMPSWWFFTPRKICQTLVCKDTSSHISYMKYINVSK